VLRDDPSLEGRLVVVRGGRLTAVCLACSVVGLAALPAATSADPSCTDTWTGDAGDGLWQTAGNWSTESAPSSSDVACIGSGVTVHITEGTNQAALLKDEGTLEISGGSLELASATEASSVESLTLSGGTLTGAGELDVAGSLSWTGGSMTGSGKTVLEAGVAGSIDPGVGNAVALTERELVNKGTLTWSSGSVEGRSDAEIDNSGTFVANASVPVYEWWEHGLLNEDGSNVWLHNTGTVKKTANSEYTQIQWQIDNDGTVESKSNQIQITGGGHPGSVQDGSWSGVEGGVMVFVGSYTFGSGVGMTGAIDLVGAQIQAEDIQGPEATVGLSTVAGSELDLTGTSTASHLGTLDIESGGTLTGAGELDVSGSLSWTGGSMTGSGKTVLKSSATSSIDPGVGNAVALTERDLVNEGTLTWSAGSVQGRSNAEIDNSGTFVANASVSASEWWEHGLLNSDGSNVWLHNTGTVKKTENGEFTQIQWQIDNEGTIESKSEQIQITGGSHEGAVQDGSWSGVEGGAIAFDAGSYVFGSDVGMAGTIYLAGGNIQAEDIQGPDATLWMWSGGDSTLTLTSMSTASHVGSLILDTGTTLTGAGTIDVSSSLSWYASSTMSGSGSTVLESGATGSIDPGVGNAVALTERELVNKGSLTWSTGSVEGRSDAEIDNSGTFVANASVPISEWSTHGLLNKDGSNVWLHNTGTVKKTANSEYTQIQWQIDNDGTVESKSNQIQITGGGHGGTVQDGSWSGVEGGEIVFVGSYVLGAGVGMKGNISLVGAQIQAEDIQGSEGTVVLWDGTGSELDLTGASTASHLGTLKVQPSTTLTGAGTVDVADSFSWGGNSTMSGSGSTVLGPLATGSIEASGCETMSLTERLLVNEGSVTFGSGILDMSEGAMLENKGTFRDNSESWCGGSQIQDPSGSGAAPSILNTGSFEKTAGGGTSTVDVNFSNQGTVEAKTGTLDFADGGIPEEIATGSWAVQSGAHIVLSGGTFLIGEAVDLSAVEVSGATVERVPTTGPPKGHLEPHPYASGAVTVSGIGASVGTGFSSAGIEITPAGEGEWNSLCGPLTPSLVGEFSCSWNTASGFYADGKYQLRAQLSDSSEPPNTAPTAAITVLVDNTPPTGSVSAASYLAGTAAPVSGTATDSGSGVASWQLQISPAGKAEWTNACAAQTTPLSGSTYGCDVNSTGDGDGAYELRALVTDNAGNEYTTSAVDTTVDNTPPTGTLETVTESEYVRGVLSLQGTASDGGSGVASWTPQVLPVGGGTWTDACSPQSTPISGSTYGCSLNTTTLPDGEYQIRVQVEDNAGNVYDTSTQTITIDNTPPAGSLEALPHYSSGTLEIRGHASDGGSGVASWQLQIAPRDGGSWEDACLEQILPIEGSIYGCSLDTTPLADGPYQLRALITDHAGNTYTTPSVVTRFDNTTPLEPSTCDDTWTGDGGDGLWQTASNWSTESVPEAGDRACIGAGETVQLTSGSYQVGSVEDEGTLRIAGGALELDNTSPASHVASFELWNGALSGSGTLDVTSNFYWGYSGEMSGSGRTVLGPEVSGAAYFGERGGSSTLDERTFVNEGFLLWYPGQLDGENGAVFENKGTFDDISEGTIFAAAGGAAPSIENTGTFEKTSATGISVVGFEFDNQGTVEDEAGELMLTGGGVPEEAATGSWRAKGEGSVAFRAGSFLLGSGVELSGAVEISGAALVAQDIQGSAASLTMSSGSLELTGSAASHVAGFSIYLGGTLSGPGSLDVSSSFYWGANGVMSGSGKTVLGPEVSGAAYFGEDGGSSTLDERTFVNEGLLLWYPGQLDGENGAVFENKGTLDDISNGTIFAATGGAAPRIENTGTFEKTGATGPSTIGIEFDNNGAVKGEAGQLEFTGGGVPEHAATGSWNAKGEGSVAFHAGSFSLGSGAELSGAIEISGAAVVAQGVQGPEATLTLSSGSLTVTGSAASHVAGFSIYLGGTLSGSGTLGVSSSFYWGANGVMSGSGRTVLESGASGSAYFGSYGATLDERTLVNEGSLKWDPGTLEDENGAVFENKGTFDDISDVTIFAATGGAAPQIENTGTFEKTEGSEASTVGVEFDNNGIVKGESGQLEFTGGGVPEHAATGSWNTKDEGTVELRAGSFSLGSGVELLGPSVEISGATVAAQDIQAPAGSLTISSGSLELTGSTASHIEGFSIYLGGTLSGSGTLDVASNFYWGALGVMSGTGRTVVGPEASGSAYFGEGGGSSTLDERTFVNEGVLLWYPGQLDGENGAVFENKGTFDDISNGTTFAAAGGAAPRVENAGTFEKTEGSEASTVGFEFDNKGIVKGEAGQLEFTGGGVPENVATGSWDPTSGTSIVLRPGTFLVEDGVELNVRDEEATIVWVATSVRGTLESQPYASGTVTVAGTGERGLVGPFSSATIELTPQGANEWTALCGPLTPGLAGEYSCSWDTSTGSYPDGDYELRAKLAGGSLGVEETALTPTTTMLVDNTVPTGSVTEPAHDVDGHPLITGTASDAGSGIQSWQLQIAPEGSSEWTSACPAQGTPLSGDNYGCSVDTTSYTDGAYELRALVTDRAGKTYTTPTVSMHIDNGSLSGTLGSVEPYIGKTVELAGTAASTGSAVASWAVQATPAGTSSWTGACPTQDTPVSGSEYRCEMDTTAFSDGEYELRAVVTDDEGNTYTTAPVATTIDNSPPVGSLDGLSAKVIGNIEVQGQASDAGSGVASWTLQIAPVGSETFEQACLTQTLPTSGIVYGCTIDTSLLTAGSYQFRAVIVDNLGNTYTTPTVSTTVESATLSSTAAPTISGEAIVGSALTASSGSWSATGTLSYTYQWQRCNASGEACTSIEGATARSYLPVSGDVGSTLRVLVTASNGTEELSETSAPSSVVQANALANSSVPVIRGSAQVGGTLGADPGSWQGKPTISYAYQWQKCNGSGAECANIAGATAQSYTLIEGDLSNTLRVVVTATNEEGSANATSAASTVVSAGSGSGIRYLYDEAGRLHIVDDPSQGAAVYEWDPDGNLTSIKRYSASTLAVLAVTPPHSPPGTQVDITGTGFSSSPAEDEVSFDGTSATVSEAGATDLIVTVPEGAGTGAITVTVGGHSSESPGSFTPDARAHLPGGGILHLPTPIGSAPTGSAPLGSAPTSSSANTPNAPAAQVQSQSAAKPTVEKSTPRHSRSAKRSARRARRRAHTGHKHKRAKVARKTKHKKTKKPAAKKAPKTALKHASAAQAAAVPGQASSQSTSVPAAVSDYRSPYPATWEPTGRNRVDGDWLTGRGPSPWASLPALRGAHASTGLSGQALIINGTPLANVTLTIQGTSKQAKTDSSGRFALEGLPAGHQILDIDGGSADGHGQQYGQFSVGVELTKGKTAALGYTIWMTPLDPAGNRSIASPTRHETIVTNPKIPGLEVRLPAGTVVRNAAGKAIHSLNMTAIPVDRPPFPLPLFATEVPTYFTVQPGRAYLNKGAQIIYPNWGHLPPGQRVDFWNYDPADKGWYVYGEGSVSSNGKQVVPDPNVRVWEFTGAMVSSTGGPPTNGPASGGSTTGGDPVDLATGLFVYQHTDLELADSAMPVALARTYRPGDDNSYAFGVGTTDPFELRLWSNENYTNAYLVLPDGGKVKLHRISGGTGFVEAVYEAVETSGPWEGAVMEYITTGPTTTGHGWVLRRRDGMKFIFGDLAPLVAIEDPNGNRITLVRQNAADAGGVGDLGPVVQIRAPHGRVIDLSYDNYNRITQASDNAGQTVKYRYDNSGRLAEVTDPEGRTTRYAYNSENAMTTVTDARGKVLIANTYEGEKVKTQTLGDLGTYHFSYSYPESPSKVARTRMVDPDGHEHVLYWNTSTGLPLSERIGSEQISYQRDAEGNITHVTGSAGDVSYSYDAVGDITSIEREASGLEPLTTSFTYNDASERTSTTNPLGQTTSYTYDTNGNLIRITDPMGRQTTFGYNSEGELASATDPQGNTTSYAYEDGEQTAAVNPLDQKTEIIYDNVGRPVGIRDPEGGLTQFAYDSDNDLISETDPAGDKTSYGYDADGDLTSVRDPEGHTQTGTYNAFDQLSSWTNALSQTTSYTHDVMGNVTSVTDPKGQTTNYTYNALNKLSSASFGATGGGSPTSTISYGYDGAGDLTSVADSRAGTWTLSYDPYHRLTEEAGPTGSISYTYNADSELQSMSLEGEEAAAYGYNADGQLTDITTPNGDVSFAYDHEGKRSQTVLPDGDSENYSYNAASQLTGITYQRPGGEELGNLQYGRDALGRVTTLAGSYARTSLPEALSEASYNAGNELTSRDGKTFSYDADGNLTSNGTSSFEWNDRNQLAGVTQGSEKWSYAYDPLGRRISKTANGVETKYLYEDENVARESSEGKTDQLINGLSLDERFARTTSAGTDAYLTDALGSTLALAGEGGEPATEYTYSPFGAATATGATSTNPYQYTGRETEENGLQYNRARYYEPGADRFISQDPLGMAGSGINLYRYVSDSPMNATDPYGTNGYNPTEAVPRGECEAEKKLYEGTSEEENGSCGPVEIPRSVETAACELGTVFVPVPGGPVAKVIGGQVLQGICKKALPPEKEGGGGDSGSGGGAGSGAGGGSGSGGASGLGGAKS